MEFAVDNGKDQQNQNSDNCNRNQPIRSHPAIQKRQVSKCEISEGCWVLGRHYLRAIPLSVLILVST